MKADEVRGLLFELLDSEDLERPGWVNYSGLDVLTERKHGIYVMGFNPGVDNSNKKLSEYQPRQHSGWSAYVDVCWRRHRGGICTHKQIEPISHQREVIALASMLSLQVQDLFATNAIFLATNRAGQLSREEINRLWNRCWPIHQQLLAEMRPKMIISLGSGLLSAFELLKTKAGNWEPTVATKRSGESFCRWKLATAVLPLGEGLSHQTTVVALPHPSWAHRFGSLADNFGSYRNEAST